MYVLIKYVIPGAYLTRVPATSVSASKVLSILNLSKISQHFSKFRNIFQNFSKIVISKLGQK